MTEFLTLALTSRPPRVALLVPDPSVTAHAGQPWQAVMSRAIEVASLYWGGADTFFVPVAADGTVDDRFIALLRRYDPDFVLAYAPTADSVRRSAPATEQPWETTETPDTPPTDLDCAWAESTMQQLHEVHLTAHDFGNSWADQYLHPASDVLTPLTPITALCASNEVTYSTGAGEVPSTEEAINIHHGAIPADIALLAASRTGLAAVMPAPKDVYRTVHGALPVNKSDLDAESAVEIAYTGEPRTSDIRRTEVRQSPFARTVIGAGMDVTRGAAQLDRTVVVGDTVEDFCLAIGLQVTYGWHFATWVPSAVLPPDQSVAVAPSLVRWFEMVDTRFRGASLSLDEQGVRAAAQQVHDLVDAEWKVRHGARLPVGLRVASSEDTATFPPSRRVRAMPDTLDAQRSLPFRDSVAIEATAGPIPSLHSQVTGPLDWIADGLVDGCRPWPARQVIALASVEPDPAARLGDVVPLSRSGRDGTSWVAVDHRSSGRQFLPIEHQLRRLRLVDPDLTELITAAAAGAGYRAELSNAGRLYAGAIELFGSLRETALAFNDPVTRGVLEAFIDEVPGKPPKPTDYSPKKLASQRRYFRLSDFRKTLREGSGVLGVEQMRELLDGLVTRDVLREGYVLKCERCLHTDFYPLGTVASQFRCSRCLIDQRLVAASWCNVPPHQPAMFHALDELVYQAIVNGIAGPFLALHALERSVAGRGFRYLLPHTFTKFGDAKPSVEIDFAALRDGSVAIGEAKLNGVLGSTAKTARAEAAKIRNLAMSLGVDEVVLWAPDSAKWNETSRNAIEATFTTPTPVHTYLQT